MSSEVFKAEYGYWVQDDTLDLESHLKQLGPADLNGFPVFVNDEKCTFWTDFGSLVSAHFGDSPGSKEARKVLLDYYNSTLKKLDSGNKSLEMNAVGLRAVLDPRGTPVVEKVMVNPHDGWTIADDSMVVASAQAQGLKAQRGYPTKLVASEGRDLLRSDPASALYIMYMWSGVKGNEEILVGDAKGKNKIIKPLPEGLKANPNEPVPAQTLVKVWYKPITKGQNKGKHRLIRVFA